MAAELWQGGQVVATAFRIPPGSVEYWVAPVKAGRIMFEIEGVPETVAREAFDLLEQDGDVRIVLFVRLGDGLLLDDPLQEKICTVIRSNTSPRHVPAKIIQAPDLPRTLNGKLCELAVREAVHGRMVKNLGALANPESLEFFRNLPQPED